MSGFVASPPCTPIDEDQPELDAVAGDAFYPGVSLSAFRDSLRVGTAVTDVRARDALRGGMVTVRRELRCWKAAQVADGKETLATTDDELVDGEARVVLLYQRAVFAFAAADLVETHNDIGATKEGAARAEERGLSADDHRRNGTHAVRDIIGVGRTSVALI